MSLYEAVGGRETFALLAKTFYIGVSTDEVLRPMYATDDFGPPAERLQLFLEQYWGGPTDYQELLGHPSLRMRHAPYEINRDARERWLKHMRASLDAVVEAGFVAPIYEAELWDYLERAATSLMNTPG